MPIAHKEIPRLKGLVPGVNPSQRTDPQRERRDPSNSPANRKKRRPKLRLNRYLSLLHGHGSMVNCRREGRRKVHLL